jgi:hypothetical protein
MTVRALRKKVGALEARAAAATRRHLPAHLADPWRDGRLSDHVVAVLRGGVVPGTFAGGLPDDLHGDATQRVRDVVAAAAMLRDRDSPEVRRAEAWLAVPSPRSLPHSDKLVGSPVFD